MLLTISTTHKPATDLGYLLHKNPGALHRRELAVGTAVMFYPAASEEACTFALYLEVDPIKLVRSSKFSGGLLDHYVNDRPYTASSLLSVALARSLNTAMSGRSKERQALADQSIPLVANIVPVAVRGSEKLAEDLFVPLGYQVSTSCSDAGGGDYISLKLSGNLPLRDLLTHLYVLIPVLDNSKHYYIDESEIGKLLSKGEGWLDRHPERELIVNRYLKRHRPLVREALARLSDTSEDEEINKQSQDHRESTLESPLRLNDQRLNSVVDALVRSGAISIADLGCGEGKLIRELLKHSQFQTIVGVDASTRSLDRAEKALNLDEMSDRQRARVEILQGALTYRDRRLKGCDAVALVEVMEHIDEDRIAAVERVVFEYLKPKTVVLTTPNKEYNALFPGLGEDALRHEDHRFEWTRTGFKNWTDHVCNTFDYRVRLQSVGDDNAEYGPPTQMAVFTVSETGQ